MNITIIPILLGDGILLFKEGLREEKLRFVGVKNFEMGVVQVDYEKINKTVVFELQLK